MIYRSPDPLPWVFCLQSIFIAGGISDCPDWQSDVVGMIDSTRYDVVNPRRTGGFDKTGATAEEQIGWEYAALSHVENCVFWFPKETLCPITLFELGKMLERAKKDPVIKLIIGWHPEYARAFDLQVQIGLMGMKKQILHAAPGWDELCSAIKTTWG
jgi:hypothetical protein